VRLQAILAAAQDSDHRAPTGWLLAVGIVVALLYFAWRTKRLGKLRSAVAGLRLRSELRGIRISPLALVPTALLLVVIAILLISR
jgi:hypothetical protein